jgi:hypothetical protein
MKRILALLALVGTCAFAQSPKYTWTLTTTGATTAIQPIESATSKVPSKHTVQVVVSGSPSACTIRLEGSEDGTNWADFSNTQTCTSTLTFHVVDRVSTYIRVNLLTFDGTSAKIYYRGGGF